MFSMVFHFDYSGYMSSSFCCSRDHSHAFSLHVLYHHGTELSALVPPGQGVKWDRTWSGWEVVGAVAAVVVAMEEGVVGEPGDPIEGVVVEEELPEGQPGEQGVGQLGHLVVAHVEGDQGGGVGQHAVRDKPDVIAAEVEAGDGGSGQQGLQLHHRQLVLGQVEGGEEGAELVGGHVEGGEAGEARLDPQGGAMEPVETRRCSRRLRPRNTPVGRRSRAHPWRERCRREVSEEKPDGGSEPTAVLLQSTRRLVVLFGMTGQSARSRHELMLERRQ